LSDRSRSNVVINAFLEGVELMAKMRDAAVHFSYSTRLQRLWDLGASLTGGLANIRFKVDFNTTRVSAKLGLLRSFLRLNKGLRLYAVQESSKVNLITEDDWESLTEFEAIMVISGTAATVVQTEKYFMGAMGRLVQEKMIEEYSAPSLMVLDLANITEDPKLPRVEKRVEDLTRRGAECLRRAHLEAERRHCTCRSECDFIRSPFWRARVGPSSSCLPLAETVSRVV
jgi:hypothetical protein